MNRRGFFKALAGTAVVAAALPEICMPTKTIFLPPRRGWFQRDLRIREVEQYLINNDALAMRYDVAWTLHGEREQFYVQFPPHTGLEWIQMSQLEREALILTQREDARRILRKQVPFGSELVELSLPRTGIRVSYV